MALPKADRPTPTDVGTIVVTLKDRPASGDDEGGLTTMIEIAVKDQNGVPMTKVQTDLWPHLTAAQKTSLTSFMTTIRTKATAEVLA